MSKGKLFSKYSGLYLGGNSVMEYANEVIVINIAEIVFFKVENGIVRFDKAIASGPANKASL